MTRWQPTPAKESPLTTKAKKPAKVAERTRVPEIWDAIVDKKISAPIKIKTPVEKATAIVGNILNMVADAGTITGRGSRRRVFLKPIYNLGSANIVMAEDRLVDFVAKVIEDTKGFNLTP